MVLALGLELVPRVLDLTSELAVDSVKFFLILDKSVFVFLNHFFEVLELVLHLVLVLLELHLSLILRLLHFVSMVHQSFFLCPVLFLSFLRHFVRVLLQSFLIRFVILLDLFGLFLSRYEGGVQVRDCLQRAGGLRLQSLILLAEVGVFLFELFDLLLSLLELLDSFLVALLLLDKVVSHHLITCFFGLKRFQELVDSLVS